MAATTATYLLIHPFTTSSGKDDVFCGIILLAHIALIDKRTSMPVSNDNQDYKNRENIKGNEGAGTEGNSGEQNQKAATTPESENQLTSDNLKGKKVDADLEKEKDKPANP